MYQFLKTGVQSRSIVLVTLLLVLLLSSCEKEVSINLGTSPPILVVQGSIETNQPPFVVLTTTIGFFSNVDLSTVESIFVHNAVVKVSDGTKTVTLKEYHVDTAGGNKFYVYSIDTADFTNTLFGITGKQYTLTITSNGTTYTSVTKIPAPKGCDTLWFGDPSFSRRKTPKNALELYGNYTDPDTPGNYVRYYTKRNHEPFLAGGLFTDQLVNGKTINKVDLFAGYNNTDKVNVDSVVYFYPGDSIVLKWGEIDKSVYDFWNTYQFSIRSGGNPFSSPINIKSNISNGALGVWAGYGTIMKTLVAQ